MRFLFARRRAAFVKFKYIDRTTNYCLNGIYMGDHESGESFETREIDVVYFGFQDEGQQSPASPQKSNKASLFQELDITADVVSLQKEPTAACYQNYMQEIPGRNGAIHDVDVFIYGSIPEEPIRQAAIRMAKTICGECQIREECLEWALDLDQDKEGNFVAGGTTFQERNMIKRGQPKTKTA